MSHIGAAHVGLVFNCVIKVCCKSGDTWTKPSENIHSELLLLSDKQLELAYAGTEMRELCDIGVVNGTSMDYYFTTKIYRSPGLKQQFTMNARPQEIYKCVYLHPESYKSWSTMQYYTQC